MKNHEIKTMRLRDLQPAAYNPRAISKDALAGLTASVRRFGLVQPIVWNKRTKHIVGGHQRVKALQAAGEREASVVVIDLSSTEEKALNVALNNPAIEGQFTDNLQEILAELQAAEPEMFLDLRLDELIQPGDANDEKDPDEIPAPPAKPISKSGDLWILGRHRLFCGDSTVEENVRRLVGDEQASCIFTDPPYGVSYEARSGKFEVIKNDDLRDDALVKLLVPALTHAVRVGKDDAAFYIWHASSTRADFDHAIRAAGLIERQYIVWAKNGFAMGHSDYRWAHEPCYYASKDGHKPAFYGDRANGTIWRATLKKRGAVATSLGRGLLLTDGAGNRIYLEPKPPTGKKLRQARVSKDDVISISSSDSAGTVWEVSRETEMLHPTQKPVELARIAIENSTRPGELVYDPFLGSGTTLIAAERTGRRCYGFDLDPKYADVVVQRWEQITGLKAERRSNGRN